MPWHVDLQPSVERWHAIGVTAYAMMLLLYAAAGAHVRGAGIDTRLYWILGGAALLAAIAALVGLLCGWQQRRILLLGWPVASLVVTLLAGAVEPAVTRDLPGTITIAFAYVGLTCPRWRSLVILPLGVAAFIVGGAKHLPAALPNVALTAVMWVLVAEVRRGSSAGWKSKARCSARLPIPTHSPSCWTGVRWDPGCR